jgi:hypothetical protein
MVGWLGCLPRFDALAGSGGDGAAPYREAIKRGGEEDGLGVGMATVTLIGPLVAGGWLVLVLVQWQLAAPEQTGGGHGLAAGRRQTRGGGVYHRYMHNPNLVQPQIKDTTSRSRKWWCAFCLWGECSLNIL